MSVALNVSFCKHLLLSCRWLALLAQNFSIESGFSVFLCGASLWPSVARRMEGGRSPTRLWRSRRRSQNISRRTFPTLRSLMRCCSLVVGCIEHAKNDCFSLLLSYEIELILCATTQGCCAGRPRISGGVFEQEAVWRGQAQGEGVVSFQMRLLVDRLWPRTQ